MTSSLRVLLLLNLVLLWWNPPLGGDRVDGYHIQRANSLLGPFVNIAAVPVESERYVDDGATSGNSDSVMYYYRITAYNSVGDSKPTQVFACAVHKQNIWLRCYPQ